jgi:endo-1,4-beta-xylanase
MKLSIALTLCSLARAAPAPSNHTGRPTPNKYPGLDILAKRAGLLYFGTAIDNVVLNNSAYASIAHTRSEFGQVTPANGQKWMYIEPSLDAFNFSMADAIIKPANKARQMKRCHNFVWHNQLPSWLDGRNWTKAELTTVLENHIKHEATHFKDECYAWDVVNEAFNDDGTLRDSIWLRTLGKEYIELAFIFARKYTSPTTRLYYNDFGIERVNNKSLAVAAMGEFFYSVGRIGTKISEVLIVMQPKTLSNAISRSMGWAFKPTLQLVVLRLMTKLKPHCTSSF